jgi:hypothetical protein
MDVCSSVDHSNVLRTAASRTVVAARADCTVEAGEGVTAVGSCTIRNTPNTANTTYPTHRSEREREREREREK